MNKRSIFVLSLIAFLLIFTHSCINEPSIDDIDRPPSEAVRGQLLQDAKRMFYIFADANGMVELRTGNNGNGNGNNGNGNGNGNNGNGNNGNGNNGNDGNGNNGNGNNGNGNNGNNGNGNGNNGNNGNGNNRNLAVKPDWEQSKVEQNNVYQTVEIVLLMENPFNFSTQKTAERMEATQDYEYAMSKTSLIYRTHRKTGETVMFLMTIVPDWSYLERTKFDPFKKMSYLRRDNKFDGLVFFHNLNGEFVNGWAYRDGDIIGTMDMHDDAPEFEISTRSGDWDCWVAPVTTTYEWCVYTPNNGKTHCWVYASYVDYISVCFFDGGIGSIGGFGVGDISGNGGAPTTGTPAKTGVEMAKAIFRNANFSKENWEAVGRMLEKIMANCMGENLYNGLVEKLGGKQMTIEFTPGQSSQFLFSEVGIRAPGIRLGNWESNSLFHEMWHGFQTYGETVETWHASLLNLEAEARFAQFLYLSSLPEYEGSRWERQWTSHPARVPFAELNRFVTPQGHLRSEVTSSTLNSYMQNEILVNTFLRMPAYRDREFNFERKGEDNFKNLQKLTKGC